MRCQSTPARPPPLHQTTPRARPRDCIPGSLLDVGASGGLAKTLASFAGVEERAAAPLLGLAGSATLGGLKIAADQQGLDRAGVMHLRDSQKGQIEKVIPSDLGRMPSASGLLPQAADVANAARAAIPATPAAATPSGLMKWVIGALVLAVLAWLASRFPGGRPPPVTTEDPAAAPAATAAANPQVVDGVNIGDSISGILTSLTGTLAGVTDVASATAAVTAPFETDSAIGGLQSAVGALTGEGKTALRTLIGAALPALRTTVDGLLADSGICPILKPVVDPILAKLTAFGWLIATSPAPAAGPVDLLGAQAPRRGVPASGPRIAPAAGQMA